jgi:NADH-quinone oxidoreductase subunit J
MLFDQILFYTFAGLLVLAALMVITLRNPVRCALALVCAFVASAILWLMAHSEFLALILVLVYVGAVMTLFLFVVMMLNLQKVTITETFVRYLPWAVLIVAFMIGLLIFAFGPQSIQIHTVAQNAATQATGYSNIKSIGRVLYTDYAYPFELAALLLLVAIVAGISLAFRGPQSDSKRQNISEQLNVNWRDRMRLTQVTPETNPWPTQEKKSEDGS